MNKNTLSQIHGGKILNIKDAAISAVLLSLCTTIDNMRAEIDRLKSQVDQLQQTVAER